MKRYIALVAAAGMAAMIAGCASSGGGGGGGAAEATGGQIPNTNPPAPGENQTASAAGAAGPIRDFNLQVKCPGIHLEKTKLKWSDDQIMSHENVTPDEIASCEAWEASQPKGYIPPPPAGVAPAGQQAQSSGGGNAAGGAPAPKAQ